MLNQVFNTAYVYFSIGVSVDAGRERWYFVNKQFIVNSTNLFAEYEIESPLLTLTLRGANETIIIAQLSNLTFSNLLRMSQMAESMESNANRLLFQFNKHVTLGFSSTAVNSLQF